MSETSKNDQKRNYSGGWTKKYPAGTKFGHWTVVKYAGQFPSGKSLKTKYLCQCVCGTEKNVFVGELTTGGSKSCGCRGIPKIKKGHKVGRWTVIEDERKMLLYGAMRNVSLCRCECGTERLVERRALRKNSGRGASRSCGCLRNDRMREYFKNGRSKELRKIKEEKNRSVKSGYLRCNNPFPTSEQLASALKENATDGRSEGSIAASEERTA